MGNGCSKYSFAVDRIFRFGTNSRVNSVWDEKKSEYFYTLSKSLFDRDTKEHYKSMTNVFPEKYPGF